MLAILELSELLFQSLHRIGYLKIQYDIHNRFCQYLKPYLNNLLLVLKPRTTLDRWHFSLGFLATFLFPGMYRSYFLKFIFFFTSFFISIFFPNHPCFAEKFIASSMLQQFFEQRDYTVIFFFFGPDLVWDIVLILVFII